MKIGRLLSGVGVIDKKPKLAFLNRPMPNIPLVNILEVVNILEAVRAHDGYQVRSGKMAAPQRPK